MKIPMISATLVLSNLQLKLDPLQFEQSFQTVTSSSLSWLDKEVDKELAIVIEKTTTKETRLSPAITLTQEGSTEEGTVDGEESSMNQNINYKNNTPLLHTTNITNTTTIVQNNQAVRNVIIAKALIRRLVYNCLDKYSTISSPSEVEEALKYHTLPKDLQDELVVKYGASSTSCKSSIDGQHQSPPPHTWFEAIQQLREYCRRCMMHSNNEDNNSSRSSGINNEESSFQSKLWECILDHPITAYVPVQCQSCGYIIPDEYKPSSTSRSSLDASIGLTEEHPTPEEKPFVRTGWFRGPRLKPTVFVVNCPSCHHVSRWYRSRHPNIILNPNKWGRLCGEQEDLKLDLANYLGIVRTRTILPLDWDHIWSEYTAINNNNNKNNNNSLDNNNDYDNDNDDCNGGDSSLSASSLIWNLRRNDDERNFIVRLDEGIGSFTRIFAISPHPSDCGDVTESYLHCEWEEEEEEESSSSGSSRGHYYGHVDTHFFTTDNGRQMDRYREQILRARNDPTGSTTQANTVIGYAIQRANFTTTEITKDIQNAVKDYNQYYDDDDKECDCESGSTTNKRAWYDIPID